MPTSPVARTFYQFTEDQVHPFATRVAIQMERGNFDAAKIEVDRACAALSALGASPTRLPTDLSVAELLEALEAGSGESASPLTIRTINALDEIGITMVPDLIRTELAVVVGIDNVGPKGLELITKAVARTGLVWPTRDENDLPVAFLKDRSDAIELQSRGILVMGQL